MKCRLVLKSNSHEGVKALTKNTTYIIDVGKGSLEVLSIICKAC